MKQEFSFKLEGIKWEELQDKAFEKVNKKAQIDGLDQEKLLEQYMRKIMVNKKFFMKQLIWLFKRNMKDYLVMIN